jgi:DNA-binding transcriptional LysR family regulator
MDRTGREVRLTAAGEALLPLARELLADWQAAQRGARVAAAVRARVRSVEPKRFEWGGEVAALHNGLVDVAFVWLPAELSGLETRIVAREHRYAGLPVGHRLGGRKQLSIADLADEPIVWTRRAPRAWVDWWAVNPRPDGREPIWGPENDNTEEMLEHVASGLAICISPESLSRNYARPDLIWIPLTDIPPLRIALCHLASAAPGTVKDFASVVADLS